MSADKREMLFKQWISEHKGLVFRVVRAYTRQAEDGDDLFQEILLQLWRSIPNYNGDAKTSTWIYRVALNTALVWRRDEKRRRKRTGKLAEMCQLEQSSNRWREDDETLRRLYEAIRLLPKTDCGIVLMHLDGLSYRAISEVVGISETNVGVKLNRAKKKLVVLLKGLVDDV